MGRQAVHEHNGRILKYAQKYNVDPDLVRSVMFAENSRGHYVGANYVADVVKKSGSPFPMNIQKDRWAELIDKKPEDLYNPDNNVEVATVLIRRITDRIERPTPEEVGSIWHYIGREKTDEFGESVGYVYRGKSWRQID